MFISKKKKKKKSENTILVSTFWGHSQFGSYILVLVNLILIIVNLQSIWCRELTNGKYLCGKWFVHLA